LMSMRNPLELKKWVNVYMVIDVYVNVNPNYDLREEL
jgi:hypothetical protein